MLPFPVVTLAGAVRCSAFATLFTRKPLSTF
jgi:hypothetical protein